MLASAIHLVVVASCGESMVILRVHDCAFLFAFSSYGVSVVWMYKNKWLIPHHGPSVIFMECIAN